MDMSGLPGQCRADPGEPGGMKVALVWPHCLALSWLHPPWRWGWWALYCMRLPTPHGCEGSRRPPHPACTQGSYDCAPPTSEGQQDFCSTEDTGLFWHSGERNQMSNPVTPHSVKQWCGSLTVGHGAVLRPTGLMYSHPRKEASLPKEGHHSDAL